LQVRRPNVTRNAPPQLFDMDAQQLAAEADRLLSGEDED
jgi:hypothetical protein